MAEPVLPSSGPKGHLPALDGVRGLAILLVMFFHFFMAMPTPQRPMGRMLYEVAGTGWIGVDLFFVLSGFLITGILFDAKQSPTYFRDFYARRILRIFPLYYGVLIGVFLVAPLFISMPKTAASPSWLWLYCSNIRCATFGDWCFSNSRIELNQFWSLAVEEHFYLIWPAVILLFGRKSAMRICIGCILGALAWRIALFRWTSNDLAIYVLTPCRMDGLALGSWLALAARGPEGIRKLARIAPWALGVGLVLFVGLEVLSGGSEPTGDYVEMIGYTILAAAFGGLLVVALSSGPTTPLGWLFRHPIMRFFGKYSYGLYVFHCVLRPLFEWLMKFARPEHLSHSITVQALIVAAGASVLSILAALASYHLYEKHFLKLKRFFTPQAAARRQAIQGETSIAGAAAV